MLLLEFHESHNFQSLEVVCRASEIQLQVTEILIEYRTLIYVGTWISQSTYIFRHLKFCIAVVDENLNSI